MSSAEKIICGTCKKYHRSSADNTNQSGGFLQKEKIHPFAGLSQTGKGVDTRENPFRLAAARQSTFPKGTAYGNAGKFPVLRKASPWGSWLCEAKTEGVTIRSHSAPASCPGGSAGRSTASGTPSPDTCPSRCSAARRRSRALPDNRSPPGMPTWTRCSRSW